MVARGVVKFFKSEKGWGAISRDELPASQDVWVHFSDIEASVVIARADTPHTPMPHADTADPIVASSSLVDLSCDVVCKALGRR